MEETDQTIKKATRSRRTVTKTTPTEEKTFIPSSGNQPGILQTFNDLMDRLIQSQREFDNLQTEITQRKQDWVREQKEHEIEFVQGNTQEELERKREQETYQYTISLARKRAEDEFQDKKLTWEKDLTQRKEELESQRRELEELRKQVLGFDNQKEQAVKETQAVVEKQLTAKYENERKLREQEVKAEKDLLNMRISTLETDNSRLVKEVEILKRSLDEASRQVKEIAVKVIESGQPKSQTPVSNSS